METGLILSFLGASILLSLMPGPDNIFVLTESLTKGSRNGVAISIGLSSGILIHTLAAATGLSIIIQNSAVLFSVIKYLGAAYLFYMALMATKEKAMTVSLTVVENIPRVSLSRLVRKGFLMNVTNPKVSLFFIAFLPQFISPNGFRVGVQMTLLGLIFMLQALLIFSTVAILAGKLTGYLNSSKFWNITKWSKVGVLSVLGLSLALSKK